MIPGAFPQRRNNATAFELQRNLRPLLLIKHEPKRSNFSREVAGGNVNLCMKEAPPEGQLSGAEFQQANEKHRRPVRLQKAGSRARRKKSKICQEHAHLYSRTLVVSLSSDCPPFEVHVFIEASESPCSREEGGTE